MAVKFLEPGGDADFIGTGGGNSFWTVNGTAPPVATDFVHGSHIKCSKYSPSVAHISQSPAAIISDAGSRVNFYVYFVAFPASAKNWIFATLTTGGGASITRLYLTSAGVLQLWRGAAAAQIGSDGSTLSTGQWYKISYAHVITSSTVNEFRVYVNGVIDITVTNSASITTGSNIMKIGNIGTDTGLDFRSSDHYIDDSSALTDTGYIWVTAKRPNANGTANNFVTQIGAGGSGYGSGHSPQVNERALSTTNGWSVVAVGATTEEYNIEAKNVGDIDITNATIIDYMGWISTKALVGETVNVIINGNNFSQAITSSIVLYTKVAGSATYPAGTGADIGMQTDATATTVSLYECGIIVAYIPRGSFLSMM